MSQRLIDSYYSFSFSVPVCLVLEASKETEEITYEIADKLAFGLSNRIFGLFFLGNKTKYKFNSRRDFREHAPSWFNENRSRVSLIGPILELLERDSFQGVVAIICSKMPLDADDWSNMDILKRLLFVRAVDNPFTSVGSSDIQEIAGSLGVESIKEKLDNPVKEISIGDEFFFPLCWREQGNCDVRINSENNKFRIVITPLGEKVDLHLKSFSISTPHLRVRREKGNDELIEGQTEKQSYFNELDWKIIPAEMRPLIMAGISRGQFECPLCSHTHNYQVLLCPQGDAILKGMPYNQCVLFTHNNYLLFTDWYAYRLDRQRVITRDGNLYELRQDGWNFLFKVTYYDEVSNGVWGLFHKI